MIYERDYTETQLLHEIAKLAEPGTIKAVWLDQARFNGMRHNPVRVHVQAAANNNGSHFWEVDGVALFVIPTNGRRRLDVDLIDGDITLSAPYIDKDVV